MSRYKIKFLLIKKQNDFGLIKFLIEKKNIKLCVFFIFNQRFFLYFILFNLFIYLINKYLFIYFI